MSFNLIDTLDDLIFLNNELLSRPYVAVDTEFRRTNKDNMRLALLQVNDSEEIYLIDSVLINDPGESCSFLYSDSVTKIFHSCKEDLEAIYSWTGKKMVNLFDTQLAEAFLNGKYSVGYQALVQEKIGIILDKGETRSNWIRRPLTDSQLNYAASDVEFLIELYINQRKALLQSDKLEWHDEELDLLTFRIFSSLENEEEFARTLNRSEESEILNKFNQIIIHIAEQEEINPTLFFSKKNQKIFLRTTIARGFEHACNDITNWRYSLLKVQLRELFKEF